MPPKTRKNRRWKSEARRAPGVNVALRRLGKRVRELRLAAGLTQEEAAGEAGLDEKHWQDVERPSPERSNPTFATLVGVARALDVRLEVLLQGV